MMPLATSLTVPVAAAGVESQFLTALAQAAGDLRGVALLLGQQALHLQPVLLPQLLLPYHRFFGGVGLARRGIDDENVLHSKRLPGL